MAVVSIFLRDQIEILKIWVVNLNIYDSALSKWLSAVKVTQRCQSDLVLTRISLIQTKWNIKFAVNIYEFLTCSGLKDFFAKFIHTYCHLDIFESKCTFLNDNCICCWIVFIRQMISNKLYITIYIFVQIRE